MATHDALWSSRRAQALIRSRDIGGAIRMARQAKGWRQLDLARACGYSDSTISRLENGRRAGTDVEMIRQVATAAGVPAAVLGALMGISDPGTATVAVIHSSDQSRQGETEDPMHRRALMTAGLALPFALLTGVDDALAVLPTPKRPLTPAQLAGRLALARRQFDLGDLGRLVADLPDLLATAHQAVQDAGTPEAYVLLAGCYDVATEALDKVGGYTAGRITADRAVSTAALSGSPISMAAAARSLALVLRREKRHAVADQVTTDAAARLEATGLTTPAQAAAYAQMLSTSAYTAAQAGDRHRALELISDADKVAKDLPGKPVPGQPFAITPAQVTLYRVGVHWSLGDAGAALDAGKNLHPSQFPTPERRGRLHTDLARAWWQWGKPDQTAKELLAACHQAPSEVTARPAIRQIAVELTRQYPHADGARQLAVILRRS